MTRPRDWLIGLTLVALLCATVLIVRHHPEPYPEVRSYAREVERLTTPPSGHLTSRGEVGLERVSLVAEWQIDPGMATDDYLAWVGPRLVAAAWFRSNGSADTRTPSISSFTKQASDELQSLRADRVAGSGAPQVHWVIRITPK